MRDIGSLIPKRESQIPPYRSQGILRESRKIAGGNGKQQGSKVCWLFTETVVVCTVPAPGGRLGAKRKSRHMPHL